MPKNGTRIFFPNNLGWKYSPVIKVSQFVSYYERKTKNMA